MNNLKRKILARKNFWNEFEPDGRISIFTKSAILEELDFILEINDPLNKQHK